MKQLNIHLRTLFLLMLLSIGFSAWAETVTYDFTAIEGFSSWTNNYSEHTATYPDGAVVVFEKASKQTGTITNMPVTKGQPVTFTAPSGKTIASVVFTCKQWSTKAQTITLYTSTDGSAFTKTSTTSKNFELTSGTFDEDVKAVKFTFSSTSNQVGVQSLEVTYVDDNKTDVSSFQFSAATADAKVGQTDATLPTLTAEYTAGNAISSDLITYTSSKTDVADFEDGVLVMKKAGTSTITASFAGDDTYKSAKASYELTVTNYTAQQFAWSSTDDVNFFLDETPVFPTLIAKDANGNDFSSDKYTIVSSNDKVATIVDGAIRINENNYAGTTTITATLNDPAYEAATSAFKIETKLHTCKTFKFKNEAGEEVTNINVKVGDALPALPSIVNENGYACTYSIECADGFATITEDGQVTLTNGTNQAGEAIVKVSGFKSAYQNVEASYTITISKNETTASYDPEESEFDLSSGAEFVQPALTYTEGYDGTITYESSMLGVAAVDEAGVITPKGKGTTTITATLAATDKYNAATATFTLKVTDSNDVYSLVTDVNDLAEGDQVIFACNTKGKVAGDLNGSYLKNESATFSDNNTSCTPVGDVLVLTLGKAGDNYTFANAAGELLGATGAKSLSFTEGTNTWTIKIVKSVATVENTNSSYGTMYYNASSPRFTTYAGAQTSIQLYKKAGAATPTTPELSFEKDTYEVEMGKAFTAPALNNPKNVEVTYASRNEYVATVATDGTVEVKGVGQTVITASFEGNDKYNAASASYTLIVKEAGQSTGGTRYVLVENTSDFADGEYIIAANVDGAYKAMTTTLDADGYLGAADVEVSDKVITTAPSNTVWTVTGNASRFTLSAEGSYLEVSSDNSMSFGNAQNSMFYYDLNNKTLYGNDNWFSYSDGYRVTANSYNIAQIQFFKKVTEEVTEETVTTNSLGWATFAPSHNVEMTATEGVEVYYVTEVVDNDGNASAKLADATGVITEGEAMAAGTGVLIKAEPNTTVTFAVSTASEDDVWDAETMENLLVGVTEDTDMSTLTNAYIFTKYNGAIGFYQCNKGTLKANKCYLQLPSNMSGAPAFFNLQLNDVPTDIADLTIQPAGDGKMYNVLGQEVTDNYKGIVIKNGRKFINK